MRWSKGTSGNPAGRRVGQASKLHREVRLLAQQLFDKNYWQLKRERILAGTEHPRIEAVLLEYAFGAPQKEVHTQGLVVHLGPMQAVSHEPPVLHVKTNGSDVVPLPLLALQQRNERKPS
jgi:hypothetical protein